MTLSPAATRILMVLGGMLALTATGTFVLSTIQYHRDQRRSRRRDRLTATFRDLLLSEADPWDEWVATLPRSDRQALEPIMQDHLRLVDGELRDRIGCLASTLGILDRIERSLRSGGRSDRLDALAWSVLLARPVEPDILVRSKSRPVEERAIIARLFADLADQPARRWGTEQLCQDVTELSVFGIDTLYRLNRWDPTPLIEALESRWTDAADAFLVQALWVVAECDPAPRETSLEWVRSCLGHENPTVRAAATGVFVKYGWRDENRRSGEWTALLRDPSVEVRRAAYQLLAQRGDARSLEQLVPAVADEPDARTRLAGIQALVATGGADASAVLPEGDAALAWSRQTHRDGHHP